MAWVVTVKKMRGDYARDYFPREFHYKKDADTAANRARSVGCEGVRVDPQKRMEIKKVTIYQVTSRLPMSEGKTPRLSLLDEPAYRDSIFLSEKHPGFVAIVKFSGKGSQSEGSHLTLDRWHSFSLALAWHREHTTGQPDFGAQFNVDDWFVPIRPRNHFFDDGNAGKGYPRLALKRIMEVGRQAALVEAGLI